MRGKERKKRESRYEREKVGREKRVRDGERESERERERERGEEIRPLIKKVHMKSKSYKDCDKIDQLVSRGHTVSGRANDFIISFDQSIVESEYENMMK